MKITNKLKLPSAFVAAVDTARHNKKDSLSATTLNKGTKEIILTDRHWDELTDDVADRVWALWGTAVHSIFEKQNDSTFKEESFSVKVLNKFVTGKVDCYDLENEVLVDWKTASVWKVQFNDFKDWEQQGLTYAWLMKKNGLNVKKCRFIALLKDHSKSKAKTDSEYPQSPVYIYEFPVTEEKLKMTGERILHKIAEVQAAEKLPDEVLDPCSEEERWATPEKWALMKEGRKSAIRLFDSEAEAKAAMTDPKNYIEHRMGQSRKCEDYCPCKEFCSFYKSFSKKEGN